MYYRGSGPPKKNPEVFRKTATLASPEPLRGRFGPGSNQKSTLRPSLLCITGDLGRQKRTRKFSEKRRPWLLRSRSGAVSGLEATKRVLCARVCCVLQGIWAAKKESGSFPKNGDLSFSGAAPGPFRAWKQPKEYFAPEFAVYYRGSGPPKKNPEVFRKTATLASPEPLRGRFGPGSNQKSTLRPSLLCITGDLGRQKRTRKFSEKRRP